MIILVLNSGSSSLKYRLLEMPQEVVLASGRVEKIGEATGRALLVHNREGHCEVRTEFECPNQRRALEKVLDAITHGSQGCLSRVEEIQALGHRVVHGRDLFRGPCLVSDENLARMKELIELAPLHMPANISCIEACSEMLPGVPQIAHFDTSFFQTMPKYAFLYPIPLNWHEEFAVRRYGFHGTSHEYVTLTASEMLETPLDRLKVITAHLGNGASITAFEAGQVLDTSMGFTPLEGLMMGTRAGSLDPAAIPYLISKTGFTVEEVVDALNQQSGLTAVSGTGRDMRNILEARAEGDERAELAFRMFIHILRKYTGAYYFAMGGADAFVFTGGIGENSPEVRAALFENLEPLGIEIDREKNEAATAGRAECISTPSSGVKVLVVPTNEELLIGRETYKLARSP
jgi:acetate kinase